MEINYFSKEIETINRKDLQELQLERLKYIANYVYDKSPFYKEKFDKIGVKPAHINSLTDLSKLPFTTKEDFRLNYPFGLFTVPNEEIVRIHSSTGTTGKPTVVGYTKNDMKNWTEACSRVAVAGGISKKDIVQCAFGYGMFTGGFGMHQGCENVGAIVIPMGSGNTEKQLMFMKDFGTTALICTPSYALYLAETIKEKGIRQDLKLRYGLFGGESWSERVRQVLKEDAGILATDNYGLSEIIGPGVSFECLYFAGLHINEDHFLPEIINPDTGETLKEGEQGELVITCLTKEALPVIRYRTKDITTLNYEKCKCGRTLVRMEKTSGRTDDMIIFKGVNVFPSQIETVLTEVEGVLPHYQIILETEGKIDKMEVQVEVSEEIFTDEMKKMHKFEEYLKRRLENILGLKIKLSLVEPKTLQRYVGKAKRVIDNRKSLK